MHADNYLLITIIYALGLGIFIHRDIVLGGILAGVFYPGGLCPDTTTMLCVIADLPGTQVMCHLSPRQDHVT